MRAQSNYYADMRRGTVYVIEVFERGAWRHHTTAGTIERARALVRQRRLTKSRITEFLKTRRDVLR
jgi:hypothetical protein